MGGIRLDLRAFIFDQQAEEDMVEVRKRPTHMEGLNVRGGNGQDYGFIVYR